MHKLGAAAVCAVKRVDLDVRVARAAARAGAKLMEGFEVGEEVSFDKAAGLWTVKSTGVSGGPLPGLGSGAPPTTQCARRCCSRPPCVVLW